MGRCGTRRVGEVVSLPYLCYFLGVLWSSGVICRWRRWSWHRLTIVGSTTFDYGGTGSLYTGNGVSSWWALGPLIRGPFVHGGLENPSTNEPVVFFPT